MRPRVAPLCFIALTSLVACSSSTEDAVRVTATDTACTPAKTEFAAGKTTFEIKNDGSKVTELYVYGEGDRVLGEVENVGPGTSRTLSADLKAGRYELACKPGQTGSGIRAQIEVEGDGGEQGGTAKTATREFDVHAVDYSFTLADPAVMAGEVINVHLINDGTQTHEFEVFDTDNKAIGEVEGVAPGSKGEATFEFATPGTYRYECHLADHFERGMHGTLTVS